MPDESTLPVGAEAHQAAGSGDPHPNHGFEPPVWSYCQKRRGSAERRYVGRVARVGGAEGMRLRGDLAAVVADLLTWASDQEREQGDGANDQH